MIEGVPRETKKQPEQEKLRGEMSRFFDATKSGEERFKAFLSNIETLIREGFLDKEKTERELRECSEVENKDEFINKAITLLEPILEIKKKNPKLVEKLQAEVFLEKHKFIKLNEVLSYGIGKNSVHIHLAPSKELFREIGKESYLSLISDGLNKLAEIVEKDEKIKKITATSPVVTANPKRMAEFGFTIKGTISEERRNKHWKGDERKISEAEMSREELLTKYLNK